MKLDYDFLKSILLIIEEDSQHTISNYDLAKVIGLDLSKIDNQFFDKFVGHLRLLQDNGCIESSDLKLGFSQNFNDHWIITRSRYRLTSRGYEFVELLKQDTIFNKIKNLTISSAFDVGKSLIVDLAKAAITSQS